MNLITLLNCVATIIAGASFSESHPMQSLQPLLEKKIVQNSTQKRTDRLVADAVIQVPPGQHISKKGIKKVCENVMDEVNGKEKEQKKEAVINLCNEHSKNFDFIHCDRLYNHMELFQQRLKKGNPNKISLENNEEYCHYLVEYALPVEEESACMRFMEDVALRYGVLTGKPNAWSQGFGNTNFTKAFMDQCNFENDISDETLDCHGKLWDISQLTIETSPGIPRLCEMIGFSLTTPSKEKNSFLIQTHRAQLTKKFRAASKSKHSKLKTNASFEDHVAEMTRFDPFHTRDEALDYVDDNIVLMSDTCREGFVSYTEEIDIEFSSGASISVGTFRAYGRLPDSDITTELIDGEEWEICKMRVGSYTSSCISFGLDVGVDAGFTWGTYVNYDAIEGCSHFVSGTFCFIFCFGGGSIWSDVNTYCNPLDREHKDEIGSFKAVGLGLGVDISTGTCNTQPWGNVWTINTAVRKIEVENDDGCFPGDSSVLTTNGMRKISEVEVGDSVATVDEYGKVKFDQIYFFGHADHHAWSKFVVISLNESNISLKLTKKHFVPTCPTKEPCQWKQRIYKYAQHIEEGSFVWAHSSRGGREKKMKLHMVLSINMELGQGLFNPYTLSGNIVVDDMIVSCHSNWVLDEIIPKNLVEHLPSIYQTMFLPARCLFYLSGSNADKVANMLGFNNVHSSKLTIDKAYDRTFAKYFAKSILVATFISIVGKLKEIGNQP